MARLPLEVFPDFRRVLFSRSEKHCPVLKEAPSHLSPTG